MASNRRQALEDELSLAQEEADQALYSMESARRRLEGRITPLTSNDPERSRRVEGRVAPLRSEADSVVSTWVDAASHDLYNDPDGSLATSTRALRSVSSELLRLQQSWDSLEEDLAAELAALEAQLATAREDAQASVSAARATVSEVRSEGLVPTSAEAILSEAETLAGSSVPTDLLKASQRAEEAAASARELRTARDEVSRKVSSTRTRFDAAHTKATKIHDVLTVLRREHPQSAWQDVEINEQQAAALLDALAPRLDEVSTRLSAGDVEAATSLLDRFRQDLKSAEERVTAPATRLQVLKDTASRKDELISKARHRVRDAQRLCVSLGTPAREARELDLLATRLDQITETANGRYPDLLRFTVELEAVTRQAQGVVDRMRSPAASR